MSSTGRVLRFPRRAAAVVLSLEEANAAARQYLQADLSERGDELIDSSLSNPDVLASLSRILYEELASAPPRLLEEATLIYRWLADQGHHFGLFDERDYFLGEAAFLAGSASRLLGRREEAFRWFDRAEAGFRHTINPAAGLANVAYARLSLRFEMGRHEDVLDLIPSLRTSFDKLGMPLEVAKCELLRGMTLKQAGQLETALKALEPIPGMPCVQKQPGFHARIVSEIGDVHQLAGRSDAAMASYQVALSLLQGQGVSMARADLKLFIGGVLRDRGDLGAAVVSFRSALEDCQAMQMATRVAYLRLVLAEALVGSGRPREAEWEILQALPTIEEQKMVPEGFAAVALLRESVKRRKTDPNALRELREHLQKQN